MSTYYYIEAHANRDQPASADLTAGPYTDRSQAEAAMATIAATGRYRVVTITTERDDAPEPPPPTDEQQ